MSEKVKIIKNILIQPKSIILIFITLAVIVISSALIELNQSRKEMLALMEKQSHSLLETILASSSNALLSNEKIEEELKSRLLNNAALIKLLFEKNLITNKLLQNIAKQNNIFRINIFNNRGVKVFASNIDIHPGVAEKESPLVHLRPIFENKADTLIIGVKQARYLDGMRYAVAIATKDRGAIVLNIDADELLKFRKQIGFGVLLQEVVKSDNIKYALLQDNRSIIAAAGNQNYIDFIDSTKISINKDINNSSLIVEKSGTKLYETRHLFVYQNEVIGVFRLGLSMEPINSINDRITRRIIVMSVFLFAFGSIAIAFVFIKQNFVLLSKKYKSFQAYSQSIIDNIGESIILIDSGQIIKSANEATKGIFGVSPEDLSGKSFSAAFENSFCASIITSPAPVAEVDCLLGNRNKTLLFSKSYFMDENKEECLILVIKDLTEIKELEKQFHRQERLAAMGELASSVAHEIRNPLNSISTIVQQLNKDFEPKENAEEYNTFTKLVYNEVNRINSTIESFLRYARPLEINKEPFQLSDLFRQIINQYSPLLRGKQISLTTSEKWSGEVVWDKNQMHQAFINIIENAVDAIEEPGNIDLNVTEKDSGHLILSFADTGIGIDEKSIDKIFNLYYTTKKKGSGLGLSIVQKIIAGHGGQISVEKREGGGTVFILSLPKNI